MAYTARMRKAVGALRSALTDAGLGLQDERFTQHGEHAVDADAPLLVVACSGGRDSLALAAVSAKVCASLGLRCGAIIVNHRLQTESDQVAATAAKCCEILGLAPVSVLDIDVRESGQGTEAAAREARYAAIEQQSHAWNASAVLLAHTQNDQAETVLIGLLRSGGLDAVAGMPATFERGGVRFIRPWLTLTRGDTTGICEDLGLDWWDDPTNGDAAAQADGGLDMSFPLRSRIRQQLIPYISDFAGGDIVARLAQGARLAQMDKRFLDSLADEAMRQAILPADNAGVKAINAGEQAVISGGEADEPSSQNSKTVTTVLILRISVLTKQPAPVRLRAIAHALAGAEVPCSSRHVEAIDALITDWHGQCGVNLPSGYSATRQKHVIRICQDRVHENRGYTERHRS